MSSRIFDYAGFDSVSVYTGIRAMITVGGDHSVRIEGPDEIMDKLEVSVASGRLSIGIGRGFLDFVFGGGLLSLLGRGDVGVTATIAMPALHGAEASSGGRIEVDRVETDRFAAEASSGGRIRIDRLSGGEMRLIASSGGIIDVAGAADELDASASSGGVIRAERLPALRGRLDASSGGTIRAQITRRVRANVSSGASIEVAGDPPERESHASSGGAIEIR